MPPGHTIQRELATNGSDHSHTACLPAWCQCDHQARSRAAAKYTPRLCSRRAPRAASGSGACVSAMPNAGKASSKNETQHHPQVAGAGRNVARAGRRAEARTTTACASLDPNPAVADGLDARAAAASGGLEPRLALGGAQVVQPAGRASRLLFCSRHLPPSD